MEFSYTYHHTKVHRWYISTGPTYTLGSPEGTCNWILLQSPFIYCPVVVFSPPRRRKFCFHDWTSSMFAQSLFMFSTLCSILVLLLAPSWWSWAFQTQYTGKLSQQWNKHISWHKRTSTVTYSSGRKIWLTRHEETISDHVNPAVTVQWIWAIRSLTWTCILKKQSVRFVYI